MVRVRWPHSVRCRLGSAFFSSSWRFFLFIFSLVSPRGIINEVLVSLQQLGVGVAMVTSLADATLQLCFGFRGEIRYLSLSDPAGNIMPCSGCPVAV